LAFVLFGCPRVTVDLASVDRILALSRWTSLVPARTSHMHRYGVLRWRPTKRRARREGATRERKRGPLVEFNERRPTAGHREPAEHPQQQCSCCDLLPWFLITLTRGGNASTADPLAPKLALGRRATFNGPTSMLAPSAHVVNARLHPAQQSAQFGLAPALASRPTISCERPSSRPGPFPCATSIAARPISSFTSTLAP
jgi:hypothetical protein